MIIGRKLMVLEEMLDKSQPGNRSNVSRKAQGLSGQFLLSSPTSATASAVQGGKLLTTGFKLRHIVPR